jgi:hypothetical protein
LLGNRYGYNNTGTQNTALGGYSLYSNTNVANVAVGYSAGTNNVNGGGNTYLGYSSGLLNDGDFNVFIGYEAGRNETGSNKLYIDNTSTSGPLIYGDFSIDFLEFNADVFVSTLTGVGNRVVLASPFGELFAVDQSTLNYWTDLGSDLRPTNFENIISGGDFITNATDGVINVGGAIDGNSNVIGDLTTPTINIASGDEDLYIEDDIELGSQGYKPGGGSWATVSDERLKHDIKPFDDGLSTLLRIDPIRYKYIEELGFTDPNREYIGVRAQQIAEVAPYMVEEKRLGYQVDEETGKVIDEGMGEYYTFDPSALDYLQINAIKELAAENEELRKQLDELTQLVEKLLSK